MAKDPMRHYSRRSRSTVAAHWPRLLFYGALIFMLGLFMIPFAWQLATSLKSGLDSAAVPAKLIFKPTLTTYVSLLQDSPYLLYFRNSMITAACATLGALLLGLPASFAIARYRLDRLAVSILLFRIIPFISVLIPWFIWFARWKLLDTWPGMILAHLAITLPLTIWLMVGFFEDIPGELGDAASLDGCSVTGIFRRIAVPLTVPGISVSSILCFTFSWNNYLLSAMIGGPNTRPLPILAVMQTTQYSTSWPGAAAAGMLIALPVLLLSLFAQRYIVGGLSYGALKG